MSNSNPFQLMTTVQWQIFAAFVAPILAGLIVWCLNRFLVKRPKLVALVGRESQFTLPSFPPPGTVSPALVFGNSVVVKNSGNKTAENVRVVHNLLPDFRVNPPTTAYQLTSLPNGGTEILFPKLLPEQQVTISYLFFDSTPWDKIYVNTIYDEGYAQSLQVIPAPRPPLWFLWSMRLFAFIGVSVTVYLLLSRIGARLF